MRTSQLLPLAAALVLLASSVAPPSSATPQEPPVFGARADLVVIDLIATDGEGRLVTDLRSDEIEVREDGTPQTLLFARLVTGPSGSDPAISTRSPSWPSAALVSPTPGAASPVHEPGRRMALVVDLASLSPVLLSRTREAILAVLRPGLASGTQLMLVTLDRGLQVPVPLSDDVERFTLAVEGLRSSPLADHAALEGLVGEARRACEFPQGRPAAEALGRAWVEQARRAFDLSMNGLATLARHLASLPGRKQVVLFSAGYSTDPGAVAGEIVAQACGGGPAGGISLLSGEVEAGRLQRLVIDEANRAQVSVYAVDVRGLMGDTPPASLGGALGGYELQRFMAVTRQVQREGKATLSSLADGTGGLAFVNTNDAARGLRTAAGDAGAYYLLGYAPPPGRKEGRFYPVDLKVARPGVQVRHRRGYEWLSEAQRAERAIGAAFLFPSLYPAEGFALDARVSAGRLDVTAFIPTATLSFREDGSKYQNEITLHALLRDEEGRSVGKHYLFTKKVSLRLSPAACAELRARDNVEIASTASLPRKGRFQLWVAAHHSGGRLAVASSPLESR